MADNIDELLELAQSAEARFREAAARADRAERRERAERDLASTILFSYRTSLRTVIKLIAEDRLDELVDRCRAAAARLDEREAEHDRAGAVRAAGWD